jgi:hypothetical protein
LIQRNSLVEQNNFILNASALDTTNTTILLDDVAGRISEGRMFPSSLRFPNTLWKSVITEPSTKVFMWYTSHNQFYKILLQTIVMLHIERDYSLAVSKFPVVVILITSLVLTNLCMR